MLTPPQLAALRQEYSKRGLRRAALHADPIEQFRAWLAEAVACECREPNAMTLATVDERGQPWGRVVLLKGCDARGFLFFTNFEGMKSRQLAMNPRAGLTFWWAPLERQVNVRGSAVKVSEQEADAYFQTRPINSRLGAWASRQSEPIADRDQLERQFEEARLRFGAGPIPLPPNWGGFCLRPEKIEFWQGRPNRLHDRFLYTQEPGGGWKITRLSP